MSIKRTRLDFENHYTQIPNEWLRDKRLSRKARGLLAELMTHQVGWVISMASLQEGGPEGREALASAIKELRAYGYLSIEPVRNESGQFAETSWLITDPWEKGSDPFDLTQAQAENRTTENPGSGQSATKNTIPLRKPKTQEGALDALPALEPEPEPDDEVILEVDPSAPRAKFSRIDESGFSLTKSMTSWARENTPLVDPLPATADFIQYWLARTGQGAKKIDWLKTWKNAMRSEQRRQERVTPGKWSKPAQGGQDEWWLK